MAVISKDHRKKFCSPFKVFVVFVGVTSALLLGATLAFFPSSSSVALLSQHYSSTHGDTTIFDAPQKHVTTGIGTATTEEHKTTITTATRAPYDESNIVMLSDNLDTAPQTIVTAYFQVKSKHPSDAYQKWMVNMLSLKDPMVIFLSPALIPEIKKLRSHALNRTVMIPMEVENTPMAQAYSASFWEHQLEIDPEKRIHRSYQVFWIWLSKSWWVTEAVKHNFFHSDIFVWSDMGCFRNGQYNQQEMVQHPEQIPRNALLFLAHHMPNPPPERIWNNKYDEKQNFFTSGSLFAGYGDTWLKFHRYFLETVQTFLDRKMFIGEDQTVLQSTCMSHPDMCAYIPFTQLNRKDNHYFGLRYILVYGGEYELWWPPALPTDENN